jgi:molybdopterin converting factor small subunit
MTMARVRVNLYATLRNYAGGAASVDVEVEPGETVENVLARLQIPTSETRIIFVNNRAATPACPLSGGEQIGAFPAIGGG